MATATAATAEIPSTADEQRSTEHESLRADLLKQIAQHQHPASTRHDLVAGQFLVRVSSPLPELNTALARAYEAVDEKDSTRSIYALVCDPHMPVRGKHFKLLLGTSLRHCVSLLAAAPSELTSLGRRFVLIYERPRGKPLSVLLRERGKHFPESFIAEKVIGPLADALHQLSELGIAHGRINPNNVFFGETLTLGEFLSEPCGYSQPYHYEPPDRAQADPAGKGEGTPALDIYAVGALAAYLRIGSALFAKSPTADQHVLRLLREGPYQAFSQNIDYSEGMTDLLRGTLNDSVHERWTWDQLRHWSRGRRFNMLPPSPPPPSSRSFHIGQYVLNHARDVAQGLFMHWDITGKMLIDNSLLRWIELSAGKKDVAEILRRALQSTAGAMAVRNPEQMNDIIARCLTLLDSNAPISLPSVRVHVEGVGTLLAEALRTGNTEKKDALIEIIEQSMATYWMDQQKRRDEYLSPELSDALWKLDRMRIVLKNKGYGFGIERCLYDLNPDLGCQSPLLDGEYAGTLRELLLALDRVAAKKARTEMPVDRHIAAYISSKLNILRESEAMELHRIPKISKHKALMALKLYEQAGNSVGKAALPCLAGWLGVSLLEALEQFRSHTLKRDLMQGIRELVPSGSIHALYALVCQKAFAEADVNGYREAVYAYHKMAEEIFSYKDRHTLKKRATQTGNAIARQIAGVALVGVLLFMVWQHVL